MEKIKKWEIWGAIFSITIGSLLHFTFNWSNNSHFVALFSAVNESTWEHLKLAFWPTFVFTIIEWLVFGKNLKNFCWASFIKLVSIPIIIIALFYSWLVFLPDNTIWDISIFILAVICGYFFSYKIIKSEKKFGSEWIWAILILVMLAKFSLFTYFPPKMFLFKNPVDSGYGIEK